MVHWANETYLEVQGKPDIAPGNRTPFRGLHHNSNGGQGNNGYEDRSHARCDGSVTFNTAHVVQYGVLLPSLPDDQYEHRTKIGPTVHTGAPHSAT